jgi:hypothetical protein
VGIADPKPDMISPFQSVYSHTLGPLRFELGAIADKQVKLASFCLARVYDRNGAPVQGFSMSLVTKSLRN